MTSYMIFFGICLLALQQVIHAEYEQCPPEWIKKGCHVSLHYDLVPLIDERRDNKIDWDNYGSYLYDLACRCRRKALEKKHEWFALHNYGMCLSGKDSLDNAKLAAPESDTCIGALRLNKTIVSFKDGEVCSGGEFRAFFYQIVKNGVAASAPVNEEEVAAEQEKAVCADKSDVALILDVSGSVGLDNFLRLKEFLLKFLDRYDFQNGGSRLGLVRYDENCYVDQLWIDSAGKSLDQLKKRIIDMKYTGGSTRTDKALECTRDKIIKPFKRPGVPITLLVTTDGESWDGDNRLPPITNDLKDNLGCSMIVLGVGSEVKDSQLAIIASDNSKIFKLVDFKDLIDHAATHLNRIIAKACVA